MKKLLLLLVCSPLVSQTKGESLSLTKTLDKISINSNAEAWAPTIDRKGSGAALPIDQITITVFDTLPAQPVTQKSASTHAATEITMLPEPREVVVYPNPASERVTLAYSATQSASTVISIYNMQGTLLRTYNSGKVIQGLLYQQLIDLSDLPAGRYMYKLANGTKLVNGIIAKGG